MTKKQKNDLKTIRRVVNEYAETICNYGWHSPEVRKVREENASDSEFIAYCDAYDRLKERLTGIKAP